MGNVDQDIGRYSGRQSVDSQSTVRRQSVDTWSIQHSLVGRYSVETRSIVVPDVSRPIQLFVHRHFADSWSIVGRYLTDVSVSNWSTLGRWSVDTWSIVRRQPFDISVKSRPIVDQYIGREFCRSVWFLVRYQQPWRRHWSKITEI